MRLAILFDNFGPYHIARLNALRQHCDLVAVQFRSRSKEYEWVTDASGAIDYYTAVATDDGSALLRSRLEVILDQTRPEVVFIPGWDSVGAATALAWCRRTQVPSIVMSDSQEMDAPRTLLKERVKSALIAHTTGMFVAGARHRAYAEKLGMEPDRIREGYDVVDNAHFLQDVEADPPRPIDAPYFLASARFLPRKNLVHLIQTYAIHREIVLNQGETAPELIILGDGEDRPAIEAAISNSGLTGAVHLPGFIQYAGLPTYYTHALAFVHVPISEQWGLVVNEAMASSLPLIVSSASGCAPDLVDDGVNGYIIASNDSEALIERLNCFAMMDESKRHQMGVRSLLKIMKYTPETFSGNCLELAQLATTKPRGSTSLLDRKILDGFVLYRTRG